MMLDELEDGLPRLEQFDLKLGDFLSEAQLNDLATAPKQTRNEDRHRDAEP
jgi:hypothetical protein